MTSTKIKDTHTRYRQSIEAARSILDTADAEKRELTAEERQAWDAANSDTDKLAAEVRSLLEDEERAKGADELEQRMLKVLRTEPPEGRGKGEDGERSDLQRFFAGESRKLELRAAKGDRLAEVRDLVKGTTTAGGYTVPTSFYGKLQAHLIESSGILAAGATVLNTDSGESIQMPKTTAHSTGALVAEAAALAESDPAFGQATLGAYKYGLLLQVASELIEDTGVDLEGYIAMQAGRAVGNAFGVHAITGDGSSKPAGIVTGATLGVTGATTVAGVFTADNLIDLHYSVIGPYRASKGCGWLMRDASLGTARKLKDTAGQYIWGASLVPGQPETILGKPVYTDPNVAAVAALAKSVLFGDMSQYFVRQVNGIRFERSDEYAFNTDLVTYRCIVRMDGVLLDQTGAVKYFAGGAA